ncbi:hypothetical protein [Mucilaginibacter frigoritolerans]|nr:hypothetical protein [Mucilaginibacter frigoritolerans]
MNINFKSHYDITEIENAFAAHFPDHEYTDDISSGNEEILLSIDRFQEPISGSDWGQRWNEDTLIRQKYLVKSKEPTEKVIPNSTFWVLFEDDLKEYKVDIRRGIRPGTDFTGFLVVKEGATEGEKPEILSELLPDQGSAFWEGVRLMTPGIDQEFQQFQQAKKKKRRKDPKKTNNG